MISSRPNSLVGVCVLFGAMAASALAQTSGDDAKKQEAVRADTNQRMQQVISTEPYQELMPFSKFLDLFNKQLSKEKKFTVRLDREAFGKDAEEMLKKEIFIPSYVPRLSAETALRIAFSQVRGDRFEIEFSAGPHEFIITTRDRSLYTTTYDIGRLLKHTRFLHTAYGGFPKSKVNSQEESLDLFPKNPVGLDLKADPDKPDEWIIRQIVATSPDRAGWRRPKQPSTIQVRNGTKLVIHTTPSIHESIAAVLDGFQRMSDIAVVMNASIYELDRADYDKDFAPLFVNSKNKFVAKLSSALATKLKKQKLVLNADQAKIRPYDKQEFISLRNAYQYIVGAGDPNSDSTLSFGTVYDGVSYTVRPIVSPDRGCLQLRLTQDSAHLLKFTKGTIVDQKSGKDISIDLPNLKKTSTSANIEIHELQPIAMAVDYQPKAKNRVWLVMAEPMLYMEEEQERIRKEVRMLMADEKPAPVEPEPTVPEDKLPARPVAVQLPDNKDVKEILQAIVENILTDKKVLKLHDTYGTPGDKKFSLDNNAHVFLWPKNFRPSVPGFSMHQFEPGECPGFRPRLAGLRIDGFNWDLKKPAPKEVEISIAIHNVGGSFNGGIFGGGHIYYVAERKGNRWVVRWTFFQCL